MVAAEFVGLLVLVAVSAFLMRRQARMFEDRLRAQDATEEARRVALYKQQKATATAVAQSDRAVRKLSDAARHLHEETRLAHERTDALASDVKRKMGG
jgi:hypothetical protein